MLAVGIDIIETARFRAIGNLPRVMEFFLCPEEIAVARSSADIHQHLASRFALKEAVFKALPEKIGYHDFQIIKLDGRKPRVEFLKAAFGKYRIAVSLAHTENSAIGFAAVNF